MTETVQDAPQQRGHLTAPVATTRMPGGIPYIIGNEAAERFSFYGMKGILTIFMTKYLFLMGATAGVAMSDAVAKERFHLFTAAVYLTPLLGAFLSDFVLGKYRTIILLSMVYCAGHGALAFMGTVGEPGLWLFAGLALISLGSGGIKPCVSAHVGDQFGKTNGHLVERVFNIFYMAINVGAFLSTIMTPLLLEWWGPHWAFGIPGVLMAIATLLFWMGRHKFVHIPAGGFGFLREVLSLEGILSMLKLSVIYLFVAVFWALFDQTGSSWVLQAEDMNREWLGMTWLSSQIQAINPLMILTLIPLFTFVLYPAVNKVWTLTPVRKISIGLFLMIGGFAIVSLVQNWIDAGETPSIAWQVLAYAVLTASEVMVSITCLEFSYTQAPRKMKSMVMALFLCSVSLGNLFTAQVNAYIQVPDHLASASAVAAIVKKQLMDDESPPDAAALADSLAKHNVAYTMADDGTFTLSQPGQDGELGTADDLVLSYDAKGSRTAVACRAIEVLDEAATRIEAESGRADRLPLSEAGTALLADLKDPWGGAIKYTMVNSKNFKVTSAGPDQAMMTELDEGLVVAMPAPEEEEKTGVTWIQRRKAELGIEEEAASDEEPKPKRTAFVGGQVKLEGAAYFWFFTKLMAATALLFVVVAYLYKPKEYLQEEEPADPSDSHEGNPRE